MTLRRRLILVAAATVAAAVVIAATACYIVVRTQLRGQVDDSLRAQAAAVSSGDFHSLTQPVPSIPASAGGPAQYVQLIDPTGTVRAQQGDIALPITSRTLAVAAGSASSYLSDIQVGSSHLREITFRLPFPVLVDGQPTAIAVQLARPLNGVDHILLNLRVVLALLCVVGVLIAAALGRLAAGRVLAPLGEVADAAEHISETQDLSRRISVHTDDEVGQLATRFNSMLERLGASHTALDESVRAQRQLIADASHELRTPVTSLRTNIEVLIATKGADQDDTDGLLADMLEQSEELSSLLNDLIELARGDEPFIEVEDVRLDLIVDECVLRAQRNFPEIRFNSVLEVAIIEGVRERLVRAINNLLDNAALHSAPGDLVEVSLSKDGIRVRDHGSGVATEDLPHIFDRFYRGVTARGRSGSGLGLAIVRQVAEQHAGSANAENAPDGGAVFTMSFRKIDLGAGALDPHDATRQDQSGAD